MGKKQQQRYKQTIRLWLHKELIIFLPQGIRVLCKGAAAKRRAIVLCRVGFLAGEPLRLSLRRAMLAMLCVEWVSCSEAIVTKSSNSVEWVCSESASRASKLCKNSGHCYDQNTEISRDTALEFVRLVIFAWFRLGIRSHRWEKGKHHRKKSDMSIFSSWFDGSSEKVIPSTSSSVCIFLAM